MRICIDAGHNISGYDTGASGCGLKEEVITYEIADKLRLILIQNNIDIVMTRNNLTDKVGTNASESINERCRIANRNKCDLFVSIHCNAGGGTGTETLIYGVNGNAEKLAKLVQKNIVSDLKTTDRGVKVRTNLGVLKYTDMPAILVETAFIDNYSDATLLATKQYEFAKAISKGVLSYMGKEEKKSMLESANDIVWELNQTHFKIDDIQGFKKALQEAKDKNSPLYWGFYKLVNKEV